MPHTKSILILEDNEERIAAFREAVTSLGDGYRLKIWRDAPSMCAECASYFATAVLISLDHDLNPQPGANTDPGTGLDAARFLSDFMPVCPVLIHSTNMDRANSMFNELRFSAWEVERIGPIGAGWVQTLWTPNAKRLLESRSNIWPADIPEDHSARMERTLLSLDGLSVGDAFGQCFFTSEDQLENWLQHHTAPPAPWTFTDDTSMALSVVRNLRQYGHIERDALAKRFAREYSKEPYRGYGGTAHGILRAMGQGTSWRTAAGRVFDGQGSCGNGGAMRAAPIGAYFAGDHEQTILEAKASAEVTHAHPDGQTGAIAIALAVGWMVTQFKLEKRPGRELISFVLDRIPRTETFHALKKALDIPLELTSRTAASILGNGSQLVSSDTVPFCLWCVAKHPDDFEKALWATVEGLGDRDTNCAIVGSIVSLSAGRDGIPTEWLNAREKLSL